MTEVQLQSKIAVAFRDKYPHKSDQLFHVSNERNNKVQAFNAQAIGIVPGVTDYIYVEDGGLSKPQIKNLSRMHGFKKKEFATISTLVLQELGLVKLVLIELKVPGSYHKRLHIMSQLRWGKSMTKLGATWRLCRTVEEVVSCTEGNYQGLTLEDVESMLNQTKNKNIKF